MWKFIAMVSVVVAAAIAGESSLNRTDLSCSGKAHFNVTLTAYFPDFDSDNESDYLDSRGKKLRTLQDFIDGRAEYVTAAMDLIREVPYGKAVCVPELNEHYRRRIPLQIRDHGSNLKGKSFSRLDVCVRSEMDSYDKAVNRVVTVFI